MTQNRPLRTRNSHTENPILLGRNSVRISSLILATDGMPKSVDYGMTRPYLKAVEQ